MSALELKIPPLGLVTVFAIGIWLVSHHEPSLTLALPWRGSFAISVLIVGIAISLAGVMQFRQANTTVNPIKPEDTSAIVTSGVYRFSRNPMYLGFLLWLVAWAIYLSHTVAFVLLPLFVLYMNRFQIMPEERALAEKFGEQFTGYKSRVRRWL